MLKVLGGVVAGIFVGALLFEVINRKSPGLLRKVEDKARDTARAAKDAFQEGRTGRSADPA